MSSVLQATERNEFRNSALRKLRLEGNIPAIVYGSKVESKPVYVNGLELIKTIKTVGRNGVISLDIGGNKQDVILTEYQQDYIKNDIVHADFLAIDKSSKLSVEVRVVLTGEAAGVKDGGVLQQSFHELSITSTPDNIPQAIELDITNLQVGETVSVADIFTQGKYEINHEDDLVIASILPPKQEEEISTGEQQEPGIPDNQEGRETAAEE
ncbi:50S ribosomal protein L25/general stress protein Ctc [Bacillus sp. CGMCC 1.16607]|uniref:50S ribosomal protein L25/general stress protein Ctc n=1 Tax=Bacillus sp. CGMCC 1.16607 TaxID=3351842 RepID=UPI003641E292